MTPKLVEEFVPMFIALCATMLGIALIVCNQVDSKLAMAVPTAYGAAAGLARIK